MTIVREPGRCGTAWIPLGPVCGRRRLQTAVRPKTRSDYCSRSTNPKPPRQWRTTNDGVMGGRSDGRFKINEDKNMEFFGTLSLANNGGFASVRSSGSNLGLAER